MEFIELNMDAGEGIDNEKELLPFVQSVSIACGGHYGNATTIRQSIELALDYEVNIGIHPSLPDTKNFGRVWWDIDIPFLIESLNKQWLLFSSIAQELKAPIHHVKWHGALYNKASQDRALAFILAQLVQKWNPSLILYGQAATVQIEEATSIGLPTKAEVFVDRAYQANGLLAPRSMKNSVFSDPMQIKERIKHFRSNKAITTLEGELLPLQAQTICIHGDNPASLLALKC
jgi:UPF0271 protein